MKTTLFVLLALGLGASSAYAGSARDFVGEYQVSPDCNDFSVNTYGLQHLVVRRVGENSLSFDFGGNNYEGGSVIFTAGMDGSIDLNDPEFQVSQTSVHLSGDQLTAQGNYSQRVCACGECETYNDPFEISASIQNGALSWNESEPVGLFPVSCTYLRVGSK